MTTDPIETAWNETIGKSQGIPWGDVPALMPIAKSFKSSGLNWNDRTKRGQDFTRIAGQQAMNAAEVLRLTDPDSGIKQGGRWFYDNKSGLRTWSSKSPQRKAASAMIAKIPEPLARWIGRTYLP